MAKVNKRQLRTLSPYLVGDVPTHVNSEDQTQEWYMHCPLHEDKKRSASLNLDKGLWYCFSCGESGKVTELLRKREEWVQPEESMSRNGPKPYNSHGRPEALSEGRVAGWHSALLSSESELDYIIAERGITSDTIKKYEIGWDRGRNVFTIPIRGWDDELLNVRRYNPYPDENRPKINGLTGHNTPYLYPVAVLKGKPDFIIIGEGEWDILMTLQNGFPAITRTGTADAWRPEWNEFFSGMTVYLGHDADSKGQTANRRVARALSRTADVRILHLPYEVVDKHGKDLTNFWMEHDRSDFEQMMQAAEPWRKTREEKEVSFTSVSESFDPRHAGEPVRLQVTIKGKKDPGYLIPKRAHLTCTKDAGKICEICPLRASGDDHIEIEPTSQTILSMVDANAATTADLVRQEYGAMKCKRLEIEIEEFQSVEILLARPSLDQVDGTNGDHYRNIRITNVGKYDTAPNNTVQVTGALYPNPRSNNNEFLAWHLQRTQTSVDHFEVTPEAVKLMEIFRPEQRETPLKKVLSISRELAAHVTKIVGRIEMHAVMDLTFHSVLSFKFGGKVVNKGWVESLILGDTRTGKSEAAEALVRHYGAGEIISGEAASYAGIIGGLQQIGGRDWAITWGLVPLNDRRLIVIDEVSGLSCDDISKMSDVRTSGVARLTKIQQEVTPARTRQLWLSNPRNAKMNDFTYGVQALPPLIGNNEDIARFDLVMAMAIDDVESTRINKIQDIGQLRYTAEACHTLLMWAWTRKTDQIVWTPGAEQMILKSAVEMGNRYIEDPPLIQAADVRFKIARISAALAARTFSTDANHEKVIINAKHVRDAVRLLDHLYGMAVFGYAERSQELLSIRSRAQSFEGDIRTYLQSNRELARFIKSNGGFVRQDLEGILNVSREEANGIINKLFGAGMLRMSQGVIRVEPTLHKLLRERSW
jgi:CHC2 zinc finger